MRKYRIKIRELNDGEKEYIPQTSDDYFLMFRIWENIITNYSTTVSRGTYKDHYVSRSMIEIWKTEDEALEVIEEYKICLKERHELDIKKIEYKPVE
jgi:hypothetical protein